MPAPPAAVVDGHIAPPLFVVVMSKHQVDSAAFEVIHSPEKLVGPLSPPLAAGLYLLYSAVVLWCCSLAETLRSTKAEVFLVAIGLYSFRRSIRVVENENISPTITCVLNLRPEQNTHVSIQIPKMLLIIASAWY